MNRRLNRDILTFVRSQISFSETVWSFRQWPPADAGQQLEETEDGPMDEPKEPMKPAGEHEQKIQDPIWSQMKRESGPLVTF